MNPEVLMKLLTTVGLIAIMLTMGLKVTVSEVMASMRKPLYQVLGLFVNFVLVPAVTLGLLRVFDPHPMVCVGFVILAVCPGAPVGPPFVSIAKGDVAGAVGLMVLLSVLSVLLSPVLLQTLLSQLLPGGEVRVNYRAIVETLLAVQLLPLLGGLAIHHAWPTLARRMAKPLGMLANVLLLTAIVLVLIREFPTLALIRLRGWVGMLLLVGASLGLGWVCGGSSRAGRKTLALTTAARNAAVALVIVSRNFAGTPAATAVVAYMLVSIFATLGVAFFLARFDESTLGIRVTP